MNVDERLTRLEHREAIKELRAAYCYRIDERDWDGFADLFVEDAAVDFGPIGTFEDVRHFAEDVVGREHPFLSHMIHNPIIEIDGETATGRWYFEVPCTFRDGSAGWIQGVYHDEYEFDGDEWLFSAIVADFNYFAEYESGWADIVDDS